MLKNLLDAYFDPRAQELTDALSRLIAIPSVKGEPAPGAPFGPGPAACLDEALALAREWGFQTRNYDGYVGLVDLNDQDTRLHILGHLDVVTPGDGWTVTQPFIPLVKDGCIYGRGADDDKGPMVAALMAMRAVRELRLPLRANVRLILGTDEECGSSDIAYYFAREPYAPYTFSPDADFPLINVERGRYAPTFTARWAPSAALPRVTDIHGGWKGNVIPAAAHAVVAGLSPEELQPYADRAVSALGVKLTLSPHPDGTAITCAGAGGHAAEPEKANNALTALIALLDSLPLADCPANGAVKALARLFPHGDFHATALGVAQSDDVSGALTLSFTTLDLNDEGCQGLFDSRVPICATAENCKAVAEKALGAAGLVLTGEMGQAHHTPLDSPFVQTLLRCYRAHTGDSTTPVTPIGGGTYVHDIPGGVAFGCCMPGFVSNLHGPDERASVQDLLASAKIFAQAIMELCGE